MGIATVKSLIRYPLKSAAGNEIHKIRMTVDGPADDRLWMAVDSKGDQITAREAPRLLAIKSALTSDGSLVLQAEGQAALTLETASGSRLARLFSHSLLVNPARADADTWISEVLGRTARLVRRNLDTARAYGGVTYGRFGDVAPVLIVNHASLDAVNTRLDWRIGMDRFRPNIILNGPPAFDEDSWQTLQIGQVQLRVTEPCVRCVLTTIDPTTGRPDLTGEPLHSLSTYRADAEGRIHFGVYAEVIRTGDIQCGDAVDVSRAAKPHTYSPRTPPAQALGAQRVLRLIRAEPAAEAARHLWWRFQDGEPAEITPGKFISLRLPQADGSLLTRAYTVSGIRDEGNLVCLSVRHQRAGGASDYMVRKACVGDTILSTGIHGNFVLPRHIPPALFLSAGSGVTPFLAFLPQLADGCDVHHLHADHTPARVIDLAALRARQEAVAGYTFVPKWSATEGRISEIDLAGVEDLAARHVWVCGPAAFVAAMKTLLMSLDVPLTQIREETFATPDTGQDTGQRHSVILDGADPVEVDAGVPLLAGLRAAGLTLPSSCEIGHCGTCKLRLISGDCHQTTQSDADDTILPCTSFARSNLRLERFPTQS